MAAPLLQIDLQIERHEYGIVMVIDYDAEDLEHRADRLPLADTVAALAQALQVSLDWILGLSVEVRVGVDILLESVQIAPGGMSPDD